MCIRDRFQGLQSEFRKIAWTDRNELIKQTIVVVCVSIVLCVLISEMCIRDRYTSVWEKKKSIR